MKSSSLIIMALLCLVACSGYGADAHKSGADTGAGTVVRISYAADSMTNLLPVIISHAEKTYRSAVGAGPVVGPLADSPDRVVKQLKTLLGESDACLLVLADVQDDNAFREIVSEAARVAVINLHVLRTGPAGKGKVPDSLFKQRAKAESMRLIGRLLGLPRCDFPRCCLCETVTYQDLDAKGNNLCPVCHGRAMEMLAKKGLLSAAAIVAPPPSDPATAPASSPESSNP